MLRPNEFKLRQKEASQKPVPEHLRSKVKELIQSGTSKKAICAVLGCSYEHLKECR